MSKPYMNTETCRNCGAPAGFKCRPGHKCAEWRAAGCGPTLAEQAARRASPEYKRALNEAADRVLAKVLAEAISLMPNPAQAVVSLRRMGVGQTICMGDCGGFCGLKGCRR